MNQSSVTKEYIVDVKSAPKMIDATAMRPYGKSFGKSNNLLFKLYDFILYETSDGCHWGNWYMLWTSDIKIISFCQFFQSSEPFVRKVFLTPRCTSIFGAFEREINATAAGASADEAIAIVVCFQNCCVVEVFILYYIQGTVA
jgi:hypothetical protein